MLTAFQCVRQCVHTRSRTCALPLGSHAETAMHREIAPLSHWQRTSRRQSLPQAPSSELQSHSTPSHVPVWRRRAHVANVQLHDQRLDKQGAPWLATGKVVLGGSWGLVGQGHGSQQCGSWSRKPASSGQGVAHCWMRLRPPGCGRTGPGMQCCLQQGPVSQCCLHALSQYWTSMLEGQNKTR